MTVLWIVLGCLGGLVLLAVLLAAGALLWVQRHPQWVANKMRAGEAESPGNLSWPDDYADFEARVEVTRDLAYPSSLPEARFDLYLPLDAAGEKALPLVVWVHGGSFIAGDKAGVANLAVMLAAGGCAVLAPNYAVAPEHPYPAAVVQMNALLGHLPQLAQKYPLLDVGRVVLAGDSAGAQIISQTAAVETNPALAREMGLVPQLAPGALRGAMLCCGPFDLPAIAQAKSLRLRYLLSVWGRAYFGARRWVRSPAAAQTVTINQVTGAYPPTYITDGNRFSFEVQGRRLGDALRAVGVPVAERYFAPEDGPVDHEYQFLLATPQARLAYEDMHAFIGRYTGAAASGQQV